MGVSATPTVTPCGVAADEGTGDDGPGVPGCAVGTPDGAEAGADAPLAEGSGSPAGTVSPTSTIRAAGETLACTGSTVVGADEGDAGEEADLVGVVSVKCDGGAPATGTSVAAAPHAIAPAAAAATIHHDAVT